MVADRVLSDSQREDSRGEPRKVLQRIAPRIHILSRSVCLLVLPTVTERECASGGGSDDGGSGNAV